MSAPHRVLNASMLFALFVLAAAPAELAAGRLERPVSDAVPEARTAPPRPPLVFAPASGPWILDPANPMRELTPGVYEGIVPVQRADGSWWIGLDERFLQFSVARRAAGGGLAHACVGGYAGLASWHGAGTACTHVPAATVAAPGAVQPKVTTPTGTVPAQWEVR